MHLPDYLNPTDVGLCCSAFFAASLCSWCYLSAKRKRDLFEKNVVVGDNKDLSRLFPEEMKYICFTGNVEVIEEVKSRSRPDLKCAAIQLELQRQTLKWNHASGRWLDDEDTVFRDTRQGKFCIKSRRDRLVVDVCTDAHLQRIMGVISSEFKPVESSFGDNVLNYMSGEHTKGHYERELALVEGDRLTVIGSLYVEHHFHGLLRRWHVTTPENPSLEFILTTESLDSLLAWGRRKVNIWLLLTLLCVGATSFLVGRVLRRCFISRRRRHLETSLRAQIRERLDACGRGDEDDQDICVVCMDTRRDSIILECGHACTCRPCLLNIVQSSNLCPLCRSHIKCFLPLYT